MKNEKKRENKKEKTLPGFLNNLLKTSIYSIQIFLHWDPVVLVSKFMFSPFALIRQTAAINLIIFLLLTFIPEE